MFSAKALDNNWYDRYMLYLLKCRVRIACQKLFDYRAIPRDKVTCAVDKTDKRNAHIVSIGGDIFMRCMQKMQVIKNSLRRFIICHCI